MMDSLVAEIQEQLVLTERFLWCFDRATSHVYGLVKASFSEVKDRVAQHYNLVKELWDDKITQNEVLKSAENGLKAINTTQGIFNYLYCQDKLI